MNTALFRHILTPSDETPAHRNFLRSLGFTVKGDGRTNADYMANRVTVPDGAGWTQGDKPEGESIPFFNAQGHNRFDLIRLGRGYELMPKTRFGIKKDSGDGGGETDQTFFIIDNARMQVIVNAFDSEGDAAEWLADKGFPEHEDINLYWDAAAPTVDAPGTEGEEAEETRSEGDAPGIGRDDGPGDGLDEDGEPRAQ